ncbi:MAG: cell division protein FtsA [Hyphomicrobiaceae bacterium]
MRSRQNGEIIGALDVGSNKVACLIFEQPINRAGHVLAPRILGVGHQRSAGLKSGVITNVVEAETAIRLAVDQAERTANVTLQSVYAAISCGRLSSLSFSAHAQITGFVRDADIARVFEGARAYAERGERTLVHMNRKAFRLDGTAGGDDPRGLAASKLTADMHAVTADVGAFRNLMHVVERCHLTVDGLVAAPYASALAVTTEDERRYGVTVIDMGGGTTTWAVFHEGQFANCEVLATGGHHLTFDIAQNLRCSLAEAERIKALYASMVNAKSDVSDRFSYSPSPSSESGFHQMTRASLCEVVRPRIDGLLQTIATKLHALGYGGSEVVLTGGASQLVGLAAYAAHFFGGSVRLGRPQALPGLATGADSPAFATVVGLGFVAPDSAPDALDGSHGSPGGYLSRVGRWIGSSF